MDNPSDIDNIIEYINNSIYNIYIIILSNMYKAYTLLKNNINNLIKKYYKNSENNSNIQCMKFRIEKNKENKINDIDSIEFNDNISIHSDDEIINPNIICDYNIISEESNINDDDILIINNMLRKFELIK